MSDLAFLAVLVGVLAAFVGGCVWCVLVLRMLTVGVTNAVTSWRQRPSPPPKPKPEPKPDPKIQADEEETKRRQRQARANLERRYMSHTPEIAQRLPREAFDKLCQQFLLDSLKGAEYEAQCRQIEQIIESHLHRLEGTTRDAGARQEAIREVHAHYGAHAEFLQDEYPPARLRAALRVAITDDMNANQAWRAAQELIDRLHAIVTRVRRDAQQNRPNTGRLNRLQEDLARIVERIQAAEDELEEQRSLGNDTTLQERSLGILRQERRSLEQQIEELSHER